MTSYGLCRSRELHVKRRVIRSRGLKRLEIDVERVGRTARVDAGPNL
jgi:hypothetical protein